MLPRRGKRVCRIVAAWEFAWLVTAVTGAQAGHASKAAAV